MLLDGKPIPDNREDIASRLSAHISQKKASDSYQDDYVNIKYFQKGSAHITFLRPNLVDKMNDIIAKHYPGMLAPPQK